MLFQFFYFSTGDTSEAKQLSTYDIEYNVHGAKDDYSLRWPHFQIHMYYFRNTFLVTLWALLIRWVHYFLYLLSKRKGNIRDEELGEKALYLRIWWRMIQRNLYRTLYSISQKYTDHNFDSLEQHNRIIYTLNLAF